MKKINEMYFPEWCNHFENRFNYDFGYQEEQRNRALAQVKEFEVAVDCGAHIGLWSKDLLKFFNKLYCFEPSKEFYKCLKKNIVSNNTEIYNLALGKESGNGQMVITKHDNNSGGSYVLPNTSKQKFKEDIIEDIKIINLDIFKLPRLDFFKIDVEGNNLDVLIGAENTLKRCNTVICLEIGEEDESKELGNLLKRLNYKLVDVIIKEYIFMKES